MKSFATCFLLTALLAPTAAAQQHPRILHIRGHITDATTRDAVAGVTVSAVEGRHSATTDVNGFFSLELREGIKPGDDVRIHIEKDGYRADDITEVASENVTHPIKMSQLNKPRVSQPKSSRSFVLVAPGPLMNGNTWDFIVSHKGKQLVDSIDLMFEDIDKLDYLQHTTPQGVAVSPNEYSMLIHIDRMYPKGRGSLFAKQFFWKPFSLEHGHYTIDISASTGRFHQELYIEKVAGKWKYGSNVADRDKHEIIFACRDAGFPASIGQNIIATSKCWPDMIGD